MAGLEYYVDTQTGQTDLPQYDKWFKWAKFGTNWTTAVLALGTLVFRGTSLDDRPILLGFFVLFTLFRAAEVAKETIPIFLCGQSFAWVQACCRRKDQAREADKLEKYLSCLILAPITLGLAFALFALHHYVHGLAAVGLVGVADFCMGAYVVYTDEWRKDFHRVRQRPDEFELDDNMDPYEEEEQQGLVGAGNRVGDLSHPPSHYHNAHAQHPKVLSLSHKSLSLPPGLMPQKSGQIKSQPSDIAVLYASDDEAPGGKGPPL